ncbi:pyridoxamine 5'-phosphate oxidase family protein [Luteococcus sp. Sow4_B9]|uniref:pyridoxamine 5'-phosphate oxidase family protein n=1 Tax=Luteococcus sp. Sow4_B9 TaxID=3438792 RepID=UPI003F9BDA60
MSAEDQTKTQLELVEMLRKQRIAMMSTLDGERIVARPMGVQRVDDDATLWFFATADSDKAVQIAADNRANLAFTDGDQLSVSGTATVVRDAAKIEELWDAGVKAWMQCEPTDPKVVLIRVDAESIGYWDTPSAAGTLLQVAASMVKGERPEPGTSGVVEV